jgi:hypothetical protein
MGLPVLVDPSTTAGYAAVAAVSESEPVLGADAVRRWEARMATILADTTTRAAMAPRRVEFAREHWDWDSAAATYAAVFADAMGAGAVVPAAARG